MALQGPFVPSDFNILGLIQGLRTQNAWTEKSASFTISTREAEGYIMSGSAAITVTAPAANNTDLITGSKFYLTNDTTATVSVVPNASGSIGTIDAGLSALLVLKTRADANGTWELIQFDKDDNTGIVKFSMNFNADAAPTAGASWNAASQGAFTLTVPKSTHIKGDNPLVTVYDENGDEQIIKVNRTPSGASIGNVDILVTEVPSGLFAGTIIII